MIYLFLINLFFSFGLYSQISDVNGFGLTYKDVVKLVPSGKKGVLIVSSSSCLPCKALRKILSEKMIDYSRVSIFYITIDSGYDGLHSLKEVKSSDAIQHEWYDVRAGLSMFPYIILVDTNRTVVSRFPDIENNIYAFKQTDLYTNYYKNHPDEDWPENELFMDQDNLKKTKPYVYNFYINNYGYLMAWEAFFESKCDTQYRTYVERILDFIENNKICIEIQDVANKYYNKTLKD